MWEWHTWGSVPEDVFLALQAAGNSRPKSKTVQSAHETVEGEQEEEEEEGRTPTTNTRAHRRRIRNGNWNWNGHFTHWLAYGELLKDHLFKREINIRLVVTSTAARLSLDQRLRKWRGRRPEGPSWEKWTCGLCNGGAPARDRPGLLKVLSRRFDSRCRHFFQTLARSILFRTIIHTHSLLHLFRKSVR